MDVPSRGIASDTCGSVSVTMLWKTVSERRIVTPAGDKKKKEQPVTLRRLDHPSSSLPPQIPLKRYTSSPLVKIKR
jgi:hypothetical protein